MRFQMVDKRSGELYDPVHASTLEEGISVAQARGFQVADALAEVPWSDDGIIIVKRRKSQSHAP